MMHIIQDVFILNNLRVLNEGRGGTKMIIEGCFQRADEINNNKRTYPQKILAESVKNLQGSINERMLVGEIDHPEYETVKLSKASHLITGLRMEGKEVVGRAEILSTPAGSVVKSLINDGVKIGISSRGVGTLSENSDGTKTVNEDYKCLTYDIVADPSTRGAFPGLSESTKVQGIVESTMKKTLGEKIFVQMLKSKLNEGKRATAAKDEDVKESFYERVAFLNEVGRALTHDEAGVYSGGARRTRGPSAAQRRHGEIDPATADVINKRNADRKRKKAQAAAKPPRQDTSIDMEFIVRGLQKLSEDDNLDEGLRNIVQKVGRGIKKGGEAVGRGIKHAALPVAVVGAGLGSGYLATRGKTDLMKKMESEPTATSTEKLGPPLPFHAKEKGRMPKPGSNAAGASTSTRPGVGPPTRGQLGREVTRQATDIKRGLENPRRR